MRKRWSCGVELGAEKIVERKVIVALVQTAAKALETARHHGSKTLVVAAARCCAALYG